MVKNGVAALSDLKDTTKPSFLSQNSSTCSSSFGLDLPVGNDNAKEQHDLFDLMGVVSFTHCSIGRRYPPISLDLNVPC